MTRGFKDKIFIGYARWDAEQMGCDKRFIAESGLSGQIGRSVAHFWDVDNFSEI